MADEGWIGVDLDGTLAEYDKWRGELHVGAPIPAMVARVKRWLAEGRRVKVFTARVSDVQGRDLAEVRGAIDRWCLEHVGRILEVTNVKDYHMVELWDDRAVQVEANTGKLIGRSTRGLDDGGGNPMMDLVGSFSASHIRDRVDRAVSKAVDRIVASLHASKLAGTRPFDESDVRDAAQGSEA